jgi:hypothetical protein
MIEPEKDAASPSHPAERRALPAAEWVWRERRRFPKSSQELFAAQFVLGEDSGDPVGVAEDASRTDCGNLQAAGADRRCAHGARQRDIIASDTTFQTRLRGWLLSE